jgi:hypothetical protein
MEKLERRKNHVKTRIGASKAIPTFEDYRGVRSNKHGATTCTTSGTSSSFSVDSDITSKDDSVSTIPGTGLDPIDSIEKGGSGAIARILAINALNIIVSRLRKKVHEGSLDRFGFIDDSFSTDFETTNRFWVDVIFFEKPSNACKPL